MRCIIRMTKPDNRTSRADALVELVNPTQYEFYSALSHFLQCGKVSALISVEGGSTLFYDHETCVEYITHYKEVSLCTG